MPPPKSTVAPAAQPNHGNNFDPWNSSSSGHQRAENTLGASTGWRVSRSTKLSHQFKSGATGGKRISDTVGAGSEDWDEKAKALIPKDVKTRAMHNIKDMLMGEAAPVSKEESLMVQRKLEDDLKAADKENRQKGIFDGLVIYINGSTYPVISDHRLKHVLAENGARIALHLGRRQVTHVILGKPSAGDSGAGGGLSASKIQKEISRLRGCGVKFVGVEWYVNSYFISRLCH